MGDVTLWALLDSDGHEVGQYATDQGGTLDMPTGYTARRIDDPDEIARRRAATPLSQDPWPCTPAEMIARNT